MYLAVAIAGKVYSVYAKTYNHAIAQAVGQAVAMGVKVDKSTSIELIAVDSEWLKSLEEEKRQMLSNLPHPPQHLPFLESICPNHKSLSLQAILLIYEQNFDIYQSDRINDEELKFIEHLAFYFKSWTLMDFWT
ncbi:hypothetical protein NIES25_52140 [Nostoc linckia NIES-25]|nr:hypothetical protein NIES25_52140 [Nostoc linckia NIES-25]